MPSADPKTKLGELAKPAKFSLDDLLRFEKLKNEQWFMRLSVGGQARGWEFLTADSATNDRLIKEKIEQSEKPITERKKTMSRESSTPFWKPSKCVITLKDVMKSTSHCQL